MRASSGAYVEGGEPAVPDSPSSVIVSPGILSRHAATIVAMSEATNLCCVKCNSILDRGTFQGLEVDLCPKCGGLWLDRGEITRAAKLPEAELDRLRTLLTGKAGPPPVPTENKGPCPACPGSLAEVVLGAVHV